MITHKPNETAPESSWTFFINPKRIALFNLSILILFLELLLIRWISTEINIFAYLQNTILICCFLGLGMGCIAKPHQFPIIKTFEFLSVFSVLLSFPMIRRVMLHLAEVLSAFEDFVVWREIHIDDGTLWLKYGYIAIAALIVLLLAGFVWKIMVPLGSYLAALFDSDPSPITAYSINIFGSLIGVWLFTCLSYASFPPYVWFWVVGLLALPLLRDQRITNVQYLYIFIVIFLPTIGAFFEREDEIRWSPYQKLGIRSFNTEGEYEVTVNNTSYQVIKNDSLSSVQRRFPDLVDQNATLSQYDIPGRLVKNAKDILIVGAGTGNDVAGALRTASGTITAVEIDPVILDFGKRFHPEHPYDSPRVHEVVDDARSVFMKSNQKYDLIVFGLLDSHTTPTLTNARLDHFVYTKESLADAASLLRPDGVMVLIFASQRDYVTKRLGQSLADIFHRPPLSIQIPQNPLGLGGVAYITGNQQTITASLDKDPPLKKYIEEHTISNQSILFPKIIPTTDNWPYLYLKTPSVPSLFLLLAGLLIILWLQSQRQVIPGVKISDLLIRDSHLFILMGAGFSLFEVYGINQAAIFFGASWVVNAIVISGILFMILVGNFIQQRFELSSLLTPIFLLLSLLLLGLAYFDLSRVLFLASGPKTALAVLLFGGPMLLSAINFANLFQATRDKGVSLGSNMLGALIGAVLQLTTFKYGIKSLLLMSSAVYFCCMILTLCQRSMLCTTSQVDTTKAGAAQ